MAKQKEQKRQLTDYSAELFSEEEAQDVASYQHFVNAEAENGEGFTTDEALALRGVMQRLGISETEFAEHVRIVRQVADCRRSNESEELHDIETRAAKAQEHLRHLQSPKGNPILKAQADHSRLNSLRHLKSSNRSLIQNSESNHPLLFGSPDDYFRQLEAKRRAELSAA